MLWKAAHLFDFKVWYFFFLRLICQTPSIISLTTFYIHCQEEKLIYETVKLQPVERSSGDLGYVSFHIRPILHTLTSSRFLCSIFIVPLLCIQCSHNFHNFDICLSLGSAFSWSESVRRIVCLCICLSVCVSYLLFCNQ